RIVDKSSSASRILSNAVGYGTVIITLMMIGVFLILPMAKVMVKAFYDGDSFTLDYFRLLFANHLMVESIINSFFLAFATTIACTLVALPLSVIGAKYSFPGKTILMGLLLTPMVMPPFVGAIGFQRFFARHGAINLFLLDRGWIASPIEWLAEGNKFWAVVILGVMHLYPIMYLNLSAALANVDPSLEEMATTLGVKRWRQFKDIVWPLARPGYFAGAIIVFIWALTDLGTPLLIGFNDVIPVRIFNMVSEINENPVGFAMVFLVILLTVGCFLLSKSTLNGKKYDMMARGHVTSSVRNTGPLGTIMIYATLLCVIAFALFPHLSVLITSLSDKWFMTPVPEQFTLEHYMKVFHQDLPLSGIKNSLFLASLSTMLDVFIGSLIAYVIVRKVIPFTGVLDSIVMIPLALPGIVLAFGYVVTFSGTFLDPLNNPVPLLVIAYAIRRLPYMVRSASAGLQQTSISLEEASATFGASRFYTLRKITFPLVMANVIAGSLLCFAYAMLDVSDSMILAMKDQFYPITKVIYALYLEQGSGELVASALGMVSMALLTLCIMGASLVLGKKMGELFKS
ncbi:MAG: iron ABC transporter permease, partial [Proteobacteria bacterium]|nr:iron ABC transporter permease [Pseudomonadota bacterium]